MKRSTAALLFLIAAAAHAQRFSLEDVLSAPFHSDLIAASAKGRIAWVANAEGVRNIWIADAPSFAPRQVTKYDADDGIDIGELSFTPDGEAIVFTRGGDLHTGGDTAPNVASRPEITESAVWMVTARDGVLRKIGEGGSPQISPKGDRVAYTAKRQLFVAPLAEGKPEAVITAPGNRSTLRWSPDGTKLAFVSGRREHAFVGVYDFAAKSIRYLDPSVDRDAFPAWSPDGRQIAFARIPSRNEVLAFAPVRKGQPWSIRVADVVTGKGRQVWRADEGNGSVYRGIVADDQIAWAAGDRIVFPWEKDGWTHLYSVSVDGRLKPAATLLTPGEFEVEHVSLSPDRREIVYSSNQNDIDRRHVWRVPADGSMPPAAVTSGRGIEWSPLFANASTIAILRSDARVPAHPAIAGGKDLTAPPARYPAAQLVEPQPVTVVATDGMKIHAQLFLPADHTAKHPAAVFFHGGSRRQMLLGFHYGDYYSNAYAMNQYLASRGYVVLSVNYRSGIGYGMEFREAESYGTRGASEVNDVIGAGLYLRARPDVDPERIVAWGGSYGGYLTAFALAKASNLFAAGSDFHGVHDWNNEIKVFEPSYDPRANQDLARLAFQSSPIAYVDTWKSPVLLIQGDDDRNVAFNETIHLAEELRKRNVDVELLVFPDEVHDFLLHRSWIEAYKATADFFERKLR
jgi:dipeptidyl aminopeptidase/acylaminoacyl peptidase